jgi:hypothetical protein
MNVTDEGTPGTFSQYLQNLMNSAGGNIGGYGTPEQVVGTDTVMGKPVTVVETKLPDGRVDRSYVFNDGSGAIHIRPDTEALDKNTGNVKSLTGGKGINYQAANQNDAAISKAAQVLNRNAGLSQSGVGGTAGMTDAEKSAALLASGGTPLSTEDTFDPKTAYLEKLGLGNKNYWNPGEQWQSNQFDPLSAAYQLQSRLALTQNPEYAAPSFADYATSGGNVFSKGWDMLKNLFGMGNESRAGAEATYEPTYEGGQKTNSGNIGELQQLMASGLRNKFGNYGSRWLAGNLPQEQQKWANYSAGGGGNSFLDYLKGKYNLSF